MKKKAIIVSGYFNPIHKGHLECFNNAKELADELFVIVNSDLQRGLKGSKEFQKEAERLFIVQNIKAVDTLRCAVHYCISAPANIQGCGQGCGCSGGPSLDLV